MPNTKSSSSSSSSSSSTSKTGATSKKTDANVPPATVAEEAPASFRRIACIRYIRPVMPNGMGFAQGPRGGAGGYCPGYSPYGYGYYPGEFPSSRRVFVIPPPNKQQYRKAEKSDLKKSDDSDDDAKGQDPHGPYVYDDLVKNDMKSYNVTTSIFKVRDPNCVATGPPKIYNWYDPCCIADRLNGNMGDCKEQSVTVNKSENKSDRKRSLSEKTSDKTRSQSEKRSDKKGSLSEKKSDKKSSAAS